MRTISPILILLVIAIITSACGGSEKVTLQDAWARPGFRGDSSAVIGASSDVAGVTEIHLSRMDDAGTMTMERQDLVFIPANGYAELSPGGLHVMLANLMKDLSVGDTFPLTLEFQRAGDLTVEVEVKQD
jgi:copper(I)-binding protein